MTTKYLTDIRLFMQSQCLDNLTELILLVLKAECIILPDM